MHLNENSSAQYNPCCEHRQCVVSFQKTSACSQQCSQCSAVHLHEDTSAQHSYANTAVSSDKMFPNLPDLEVSIAADKLDD